MICSKCGVENNDNDFFCVGCGNKLSKPQYCMNCGKLNQPDYIFCKECGVKLTLPVETIQKNQNNTTLAVITSSQGNDNKGDETISNTPVQVVNSNDTKSPYAVYRRYNDFVLTERSILCKHKEFPYAVMTNIILGCDASASAHGTLAFIAYDKLWTPQFSMFENEQRLIKDLEYANEQIDRAHGRQKHYRYRFQSLLNTRVEVYDDYIILYTLKKGFMQVVRNFAVGGMSEIMRHFSEISAVAYSNAIDFVIDGKTIRIALINNDRDKAVEAVNYINSVKASPLTDEIKVEEAKVTWKSITGQSRSFPLKGKELKIPAELDQFNSYMLKFRYLASLCANEVIIESRRKVHDLMTFIAFFFNTYERYLDVMISKAVDILIAEGAWTVTHEYLKDQFVQTTDCKVLVDMMGLIEQLNLYSEARQSTLFYTVASLIPSISERIPALEPAQQYKFFNSIDLNTLYDHVFVDYVVVLFTMMRALNDTGKNVWTPSDEKCLASRNIFSNISHPNFPEDKKIDAFFGILANDPYQVEYYKYMLNQWGENDETIAIKNYFGFLDFNNPRMTFVR